MAGNLKSAYTLLLQNSNWHHSRDGFREYKQRRGWQIRGRRRALRNSPAPFSLEDVIEVFQI